MTKTKKSIIVSFMLAMIIALTSLFPTTARAAGTETLPIGQYSIGSFTFTDNNLTQVKTMPSGARTLVFGIKFRKAANDTGVGQVKLRFQIRNTNGLILQQQVVTDVQDRNGYTMFVTDPLNVSPGQQFQLFFDAVSAGQSNGNYRSIEVAIFNSYINCDIIVF